MISIFKKSRLLSFMFFMILFKIRLSSQILISHKHAHKKKSLLPFQNSSPIILQNIFKYLNLEDFSTIQIAYQKSQSSILQKQFLKISKSFFKKTLDHKMIFEFSINPASISRVLPTCNFSQTIQTKFCNCFLKPKTIQFSNFINHVMIYHEFRFISYIDESFSIEQKIQNTKDYKPITIQNGLPKHSHLLNFVTNFSKLVLNLALESNHQLYTFFKNGQISTLDCTVSIDSENLTYFVSFDETYVVRFIGPQLVFYHIPAGKCLQGYSYSWMSWALLLNPKDMLDFTPFTEIGEFLPSCHHPKIKQIIFKKKIEKWLVSEQDKIFIKFQINCKSNQESPLDDSLYLTDNLYIDLSF